ncbi:hypothetical protein RFI_23624 [Reticulomyxa filosa]|uniref:G-protein coupled receptors family 2 profile 2 domain-containing protein n=1 Tax=Reticulomyxa filosa TaxID=46433 RepID=X6MIA3_RETFI|nr:hypothetical protein RFI_23624 [Reticulomyxa filosa]|eukprot:ETO13743.1 hypothetical protein RFI_23624 [Reticulomyxa filosa]
MLIFLFVLTTISLFLWMSIFDAMIAVVSMFGPMGLLIEQTSGNLSLKCTIQAMVLNFATFGSNIWSFFFGIHLIRLTSTNAQSYALNNTKSYVIYLTITLLLSSLMTLIMTIIEKDNYMYIIGVNVDFWCWIKNSAMLDNHKYLVLSIPLLVCSCSLLIIYTFMRIQLKKLHQVKIPKFQHYQLINRRIFLRTISSGYCTYLAAPFVAYAPANFCWLCSDFGNLLFVYFYVCWATLDHTTTWFVISGLILGVFHFLIFSFLIPLVHDIWVETCRCKKTERRKRSLRESDRFFMELL